MSNNELYHYGVPGMRWGHRKQVPIQGQNIKTATTQQTSATKTTSKPKMQTPKHSTKPKTQTTKKQETQQNTQQETNKKAAAWKKGLIAAGVVLAVIGTVVVAHKLGQNKGAANAAAMQKKVETGKKTVDMMKTKKVSKAKTKIDITQAPEVFKGLPKPPKPVAKPKTANPLIQPKTSLSKFNTSYVSQPKLSSKHQKMLNKMQTPKTFDVKAANKQRKQFAKNYMRLMRRR